jgi:SAM-dependent methyltransferase
MNPDDYIEDIIRHYNDRADERRDHFLKSDPARIMAGVEKHLPSGGRGTIADIGAGAGRDAAWLAARGYRVFAVEPAPALLQHGRSLTEGQNVTWLDDRLPALPGLKATGQKFDLVLLNAVWMFVPQEMRPVALETLKGLLLPHGKICLSIRCGPPTPGREYIDTKGDEFFRLAPAVGLAVLSQQTAPDSLDRPGYSWLEICLERDFSK